MPRPRKEGVVAALGDGRYKVRVELADGSFVWHTLKQKTSETKARDLSVKWSEDAKREGLRGANTVGGPTETYSEWMERWEVSRRAKGLATVSDDLSRYRTWIAPHVCADGVTLGSKPIASIDRRDLEGLVEALDRNVQQGALRWKTAINVWSVVTKSFKDACRSKVLSIRVREDNPSADVEGPDRGAERSKVFVYPSEVATFVECDEVPLEWRRLVAIAVYLGARAGELEAIEWEDFDLDHGKVNIHRAIDHEEKGGTDTKTVKDKEPRRYSFEPNLRPLLEAMHEEADGTGRVFPNFPRSRDLAEGLRILLAESGVTRRELFVSDETRLNLRFHDLRASTVTWMAGGQAIQSRPRPSPHRSAPCHDGREPSGPGIFVIL